MDTSLSFSMKRENKSARQVSMTKFINITKIRIYQNDKQTLVILSGVWGI